MKTYSDSTLMSWNKSALIDYIRCLEHNYKVRESAYEHSIDLNTKLVKLLNENKIEWLYVNKAGSYEVIDHENS